MFDPQPHLIKLPRKVKDRATGHYTTVYDAYLEVKWRLCWFRDRYPRSGMAINALKPAQLAMLVSKVARFMHDDGDRWVPLLAALQAERAARLARGQRRPVTPGPDISPPAIAVASGPVL